MFTIKRQRKSASIAKRITDSSLQNVGNGKAPNNGVSAIVVAISSVSELLVSCITSMKSAMVDSLGQMKDTIFQLVIEEGPSEEIDEQLQMAAKMDERSVEQSDKTSNLGPLSQIMGLKSPQVVNQPSRALIP